MAAAVVRTAHEDVLIVSGCRDTVAQGFGRCFLAQRPVEYRNLAR